MFKNYNIRWIGWGGEWFIWNHFRFNSGNPYTAWRIGPVIVKRYERFK